MDDRNEIICGDGYSVYRRGIDSLNIIRGRTITVEWIAARTGVSELAVPDRPNTVAFHRNGRTIWLGPDKLLVEGRYDYVGDSVIDVGSHYVSCRLSGPNCVAVLTSRSPLDVRPWIFPEGHSAATRFGDVWCLVVRLKTDAFDLFVQRSYWDYFEGMISAEGGAEKRKSLPPAALPDVCLLPM